MKSIKDLREQYDLITEKEEAETKKLAALVRAGLFDAKKMTSLKRALDKPVDKMTAQEKRMLLNLLDALMSEVLSNQPVYQKVKQNVMKEAKDYYATPDPRVQRVGYPSQKEAPSVLLLKRKAIRVFPDGQKVALYYAQAIDKYVSIPYNEIGINEEIQIDEGFKGVMSKIMSGIKYMANTSSSGTDTGSSRSKLEKKYSEPKSTTYKPTIVGINPKKDEEDSPAVLSKMRQQYRKQLQMQQIYEYSASDAASDAADILIPGVSAYRNFKKGNYGQAALDAAIDVGSAALSVPTLGGAWAARSALKAGVKGGERLLAKTAEKAAAKTAEKTRRSTGSLGTRIGSAAARLGLGSMLDGSSNNKNKDKKSNELIPLSSKYKPEISDIKSTSSDDALKSVEKKLLRKSLQVSESKSIYLDGNQFVLNNKEADKVLSLYESLNAKNKQKMIKMMNESEEQLNKIISFAVRQ